MIKNSNDTILSGLHIDSKYYLFYQIWKELTDKFSMDSYQYRILNSLSALDELNTVIGKRLNRSHLTNHNVDECRNETAEIIKADPIVKKYYFSIWTSLIKHLNKNAESDSQLRALLYQIQYAYAMLSPKYLLYLCNDIEDDINCGRNPQIIEKTNMIVSCCAAKGWSTTALNGLIDQLKGSDTDQTKWAVFMQSIQSSIEDEYSVYIPLSLNYKSKGIPRSVMAEKVKAEIVELGISVYTIEQVENRETSFHGVQLPRKDYMSVSVTAYDSYAASYSAIDRCSDVLSMLSFYNYIEAWNCQDVSCWIVNHRTQEMSNFRSSQLFFSYDYIDSNARIFRASKNVFSNSSASINKKLQASYSYANMGKASGSQEEKFMNTWVALESLCRSDVYDNIISSVLEVVPSALCSRYIYRHFRNFLEDCKRCEINLSFSSGGYSFYDARSRQEHVRDLIQIFNDPVLFGELESKCLVNTLLSYRCKEMHTLAVDPTAMINKIKRHYMTVRQQLSRLYRIRNSIAHTGMTSTSSLMLYIEHLEDYLSGFVSEVVTCAFEKQETSAEIVFEMIKDNYNVFVDVASNKNNATVAQVLSDLFSSGIIKLI